MGSRSASTRGSSDPKRKGHIAGYDYGVGRLAPTLHSPAWHFDVPEAERRRRNAGGSH